MRLLLVNDDGIDAIGILLLRDAALRHGHEVYICAPMYQQSGKGHSIKMEEPIFVRAVPMDGVAAAFAIDSTPADCIRLGLNQLVPRPDAVLSGMNNGQNAGTDIYYSGTAGAAREAALHGLKAVAVSIQGKADLPARERAAEHAVANLDEWLSLPAKFGDFVNLNYPYRSDWQEMRRCVVDTHIFRDTFERRESPRRGTYYWMGTGDAKLGPDEGSDQEMLNRGIAACSVISLCTGQ